MSNPYLDPFLFTPDYERPSFAIFKLCEICGRSFHVDDLEEGVCVHCTKGEEDSE
jgi:hypothetical protein